MNTNLLLVHGYIPDTIYSLCLHGILCQNKFGDDCSIFCSANQQNETTKI